jgi:hypothetical protein
MKRPLDGPIQPAGGDDDWEDISDERLAERLEECRRVREVCLHHPERIRALGGDPAEVLRETDQNIADLIADQAAMKEAEDAVLHAKANLSDRENQVAFLTVAAVLDLEKQLPALRETMTAGELTEAENLLRDWRKNREEFLAPLTAEQRRELGV